MPMLINNQHVSIQKFAADWKARGSEKSDARSFWIELLQALGIEQPTKILAFEVPVDVDEHQCFIDGWITPTKVLIEHKSRNIDLDKPARQSDGKFLTPFDQALRYAYAMPFSQRPRWIVVCNFVELRIFDMDRWHKEANYAPKVIAIERLPHEFSRLNFLIDPNDDAVDPSIRISKRAGEIVADLYNAFDKCGDCFSKERNYIIPASYKKFSYRVHRISYK